MASDQSLTFVFLCGKKDRNGFFVTEEFFRFLESYFLAREKSSTWSDLFANLDAFGCEFMRTFYDCEQYNDHSDEDLTEESSSQEDDLDIPGPYDHLEPWVFRDVEFPVIQCATETYEKYRHIFPDKLEQGQLTAEFGMPVGLYPRYRIPEISEHLAMSGYKLLVRLFKWNAQMCNYDRNGYLQP